MANETEEYSALKLENQVCFPLYACSKELVRQYGPYLKALNLTYTQYIVMMVLWEKETVSSRELASCLHLDYGTLTPVLKRLDQAGYLTRARAAEDERLLTLQNMVDQYLQYLTTGMDTGGYTTNLQVALAELQEIVNNLD